MSEFHYVRTLGTDGGVDACEGPAIGLDLETVLSDGLPPWKVALEIVAALCEILDIAEEDGEVHGDVHPKYVFIDETGAVSLEGFGVKRGRTRAPEGTPKDCRSDLYGLGYTAYRVISSYPLPDHLPDDDPDAHDDAIIDAALEIDLSQVPDEMQGDVQWFVAKLMAFDREDRPSAREAWRTFIAFAHELEDPDVGEWCAAALDGGGTRRSVAPATDDRALPDTPEPTDEEDLGGPLVGQGPLSGKKITFDDGGSQPNRGATAFWTRDQMKKALDRAAVEADTQDEGPPMGVGGGSATSFWSREQLDAMARGDQEAPRPRRAEGQGERRRATATQRTPGPARPDPATGPLPPAAPPPQHQPLPPPSPPPPPQHQPLPPPSPPQQPQQPQQQQAYASSPSVPSPSWEEEPYPEQPDEGGGGLKFVLFGGGVAAFGAALIAIVVVILIIVLIYVMSGNGTTASVTVPPPAPLPTPIDPIGVEPEGVDGNGTTDEPPAPEPPPRTQPRHTTTPKPPPRPTSTPRPPPRPRSTPKPPPPTPKPPPITPSPAPTATGDARVQLRSNGRGRVTGCTTSASVDFDGIKNFTVEAYKLPATCLVEIDGARNVFQVMASGDITCDRQGATVQCDKSQVP